MATFSLCMIVRDEEDVIGRCLDSVKDIVDEIIIVDTGSIDKTIEIVKRYRAKTYYFKWIYDFSAARNYAFSKASMDYIMWLDADDVIDIGNRESLKKLKETLDPSIDVVMMKYNVGFDVNGEVNFSYYRERILKRSKMFKWQDPVHEFIQPEGNILRVDIAISHKKEKQLTTERNLKIYEKMIAQEIAMTPRNLFYYSRELYYNEKYEAAILNYDKFLSSEEGWVEDRISACFDLCVCYKKTNQINKIRKALLKSLEFDKPRAEICCQLGYYYFDKEDYDRAICWFELATKLKRQVDNWGFFLHDCWGFLPWIQLCVCYYKKGNIKEAIKCNDKAAEYKPMHSSILKNKNLFSQLINDNKSSLSS